MFVIYIYSLYVSRKKGFESFIPIIYNHFKDRFSNIKNNLGKLQELENFKSIMKCNVYGMQSKPNISKLNEDLDIMYRTITNNVEETECSCSAGS